MNEVFRLIFIISVFILISALSLTVAFTLLIIGAIIGFAIGLRNYISSLYKNVSLERP